MKYLFFLIVLSFSILVACSESSTETESTPAIAPDVMLLQEEDIPSPSTPLPQYFSQILVHYKALNLDENSLEKIKEEKNNNLPEILELEAVVKQVQRSIQEQYKQNFQLPDLLGLSEKNSSVYKEVAILQLEYNQNLLQLISPEQQKQLIQICQEKNILLRSPLADYFNLMANATFKLSPQQEEKKAAWKQKYTASIPKLTKQVQTIQENIYNASLMGDDSKNILKLFDEMTAIQKKLLVEEITCRDEFINNIITKKEWTNLVK